MINSNSVIIQTNEFDVVDLDNEKVIMNLEKGKYFTLNVIGSIIFELIIKEKSVKEIIDFLLSEYNVERKVCEECVLEYLKALEKIDLIKAI